MLEPLKDTKKSQNENERRMSELPRLNSEIRYSNSSLCSLDMNSLIVFLEVIILSRQKDSPIR